uniref:Disease resistance protein RGA2 n=1 Tax=Anthurium amnicola TaxID=1678845 RepID=A0A1D1YVR4_9ARAE
METAIAAAAAGAAVGAVVSSFLKPWADQAASLAQTEIARLWGVKEDLERLSHKLRLNQSVLEDAEQKQFSDKHVSVWLEQFKDAAYDAEDVLDVLATEDAIRSKRTEEVAIRSKTTGEEKGRPMRQVSGFQLLCCLAGSSSSASKPKVNREIAQKIGEIDRKLEYLKKERENLGLRNLGKEGQIEIVMGRETSSANEENLFGRKEEKEAIIKELIPSGDEPEGTSTQRACGGRVSLVPIVGMGGIGKTTLAQMVFNDQRVQRHFPLKKWICVSDNFDPSRLIAEIVEDGQGQSTIEDLQKLTLEQLQMKLRDTLKNKEFLVVLDDVWCEDQITWRQLWAPLNQEGDGGKVIVTTRSQRVVKAVYPMTPKTLMQLSDEHCWSIFERRAFVNGDSDSYPSLKEIGWQIVKKLKGIPLAAKLVAGFLGKILEEDIWRSILESNIWPLPEGETDILPILRLSYHHLPAHLKRCFAYCAIFPKDYKLDVSKLVRLWMAQGFIQSQGNRRMEDLGNLYFKDLLQRSFYQYHEPVEAYHEAGYYVMHDLIHDLAESVSKDECLRIGEENKPDMMPEKVRHVSLSEMDQVHFAKFERSRTFLNLPAFTWEYQGGESLRLPDTSTLGVPKSVRVLILGKVDVNELPPSIGNLVHLRYLQVHGVKRLPQSLCKLHNLQTLILDFDTELPEDMSRLVNLRHLAAGPEKVASISGVSRLTCLQELKMFSVGRKEGHRIRELQNLRQIRGGLCVVNLENVDSKEQAMQVNLKAKVHLCELALVWNVVELKTISTCITKHTWKQFGYEEEPSTAHDLRRLARGVRVGNDKLDEEVLDRLDLPPNLTRLWIVGNCGVRLPGWMQKQTPPFSHVTHLRLYSCLNWDNLPPLGHLCHLKVLELFRMHKVKRVGLEFYGGEDVMGSTPVFPSLEVLEFNDMPEWEEWVDVPGHRVFPSLRQLVVHDGPKLSKLPPFLIAQCGNLACLDISWCPQVHSMPDKGLPSSLVKLHIQNCPTLEQRCRHGGQEWDKIAHVRDILIHPA